MKGTFIKYLKLIQVIVCACLLLIGLIVIWQEKVMANSNTLKQLRLILPTAGGLILSSGLPEFDNFKTSAMFLFVPSSRLIVSLDVVNSTARTPYSYRY
jgi:hypothetical protein